MHILPPVTADIRQTSGDGSHRIPRLYYSSNTQSSSNGDFRNTDEVWCRYGIGRVVTSVTAEGFDSSHHPNGQMHINQISAHASYARRAWFGPEQSVSRFVNTNLSKKGGQLSLPVSLKLTLSQKSPGFYVSTVQVFWKHSGKMRKLLVTSNFSFSHSVFYSYGEICAIFIKFKIVVCKLFLFGRV